MAYQVWINHLTGAIEEVKIVPDDNEETYPFLIRYKGKWLAVGQKKPTQAEAFDSAADLSLMVEKLHLFHAPAYAYTKPKGEDNEPNKEGGATENYGSAAFE